MRRTVEAGTFVTPKVRLTHRLGSGGMGEVWVADHLALNTRVAVKVIKGLDHDENARARFEREATAAARIQSPHVVQIFDYGVSDGGQPFIIMELLAGESLADRIGRGPLSLKELASIIMQTASALHTAHQAGVVHRDIKPPNIFLVDTPTREPFVKVLDFGIARVKEDHDPTAAPLTTTGAMLGTPDYMSPEQLLTGEMVSHKSDVWSLGVVAYEALAGARPFTGTTVVALCMAICEARYERERVSPALRPWFERAFAVDPVARFGSVMEAAEAFRAVAEAAVTGVTLVSAPEPPTRGVTGATIAVLSAVAMLLGASTTWLLAQPVSRGTRTAAADKSADATGKKKKKTSKPKPSDEEPEEVAPVPPAPTPTPSAVEPDPSPSSVQPPPVPPQPAQPVPPKTSAECTRPCKEVGACQWNGTSCLVASSSDCAQSGGCREMGACTKVGGQCRPGSDADCAKSSRCKSQGNCSLMGGPGGTCGATQASHCRQSLLCSTKGRCAAQNGSCVPANDADCRASTQCAQEGACKKSGMICVQ